jgi:hypothetical protein
MESNALQLIENAQVVRRCIGRVQNLLKGSGGGEAKAEKSRTYAVTYAKKKPGEMPGFVVTWWCAGYSRTVRV